MKRYLILLLLLLAVDCNAAILYVSQSTANGYSIGVDGNDGLSKALPKLTVPAALTAATANDTIIINDGTYTNASFYNITKNVTINSETPYGAILQSDNSIRAVYLGPAANLTVTFGQIVIDAKNVGQNCISHSAAAVTFNETYNGTKLINPTLSAIDAPITSTLLLTVRNIIIEGSGVARGGIYASSLNGTSVIDIDGVTFNISGHTTTLRGVVVLKSVAAGTVATVKRVAGTMSITASSGEHYGVRITNIANAIIESCDINTTGGTGTAGGFHYVIDSDITTPIDSSGGVIRNNLGNNSTPAGIITLIGQDSSAVAGAGKNYSNNGQIYGNYISGTAANRAAVHGYMIGNQTDGVIYNNYADSVSYLAVFKGNLRGVAHHNTGTNIAGIGGLRAKAAVDSAFYNNTVQAVSGYGLYADHDTATSIFSSGILFKNNIVYATGPMTGLAAVGTGSTGSFANNLYYSTVALPANPWIYTTNNYANIAAWQGAQEATAIYSDPKITGIGRLNSGSPAKWAGVNVSLATDYAGKNSHNPPCIGAFEFTELGGKGGFFGTNWGFGL